MIRDLIAGFAGKIPSELKRQVKSSSVGAHARHIAHMYRTPGISYAHGSGLSTLKLGWETRLAQITRDEEHLLTKTSDDFRRTAKEGYIIVATDLYAEGMVIGCITLWSLGTDHSGREWFELGSFVLHPEYRFGQTGMPIGDTLYQMLLLQHRDKNIIGTTTNPHAIHTGQRHGMIMTSFFALPTSIHQATCVCPMEKTDVERERNARSCVIKNSACRIRMTTQTWERMGRPTQMPWTA
jgi:hypothetical protein